MFSIFLNWEVETSLKWCAELHDHHYSQAMPTDPDQAAQGTTHDENIDSLKNHITKILQLGLNYNA